MLLHSRTAMIENFLQYCMSQVFCAESMFIAIHDIPMCKIDG